MGNYPRKIDEYLALGKPTLATKTLFMDYFKDFTYLVNGETEWIECIEKALLQNNEEYSKAKRAFAITHSWGNNVEAISKLIVEKQKIKC